MEANLFPIKVEEAIDGSTTSHFKLMVQKKSLLGSTNKQNFSNPMFPGDRRTESTQKAALNLYEKTYNNPDQYLCEIVPPGSQQKLGSHHPLLKGEFDFHCHLLQQMPSVIVNFQQSVTWDIILFKIESTKFTFGIPGECVCFICNHILKSVPEKQTHQILLHG